MMILFGLTLAEGLFWVGRCKNAFAGGVPPKMTFAGGALAEYEQHSKD